jgi:hypothetical protein
LTVADFKGRWALARVDQYVFQGETFLLVDDNVALREALRV